MKDFQTKIGKKQSPDLYYKKYERKIMPDGN